MAFWGVEVKPGKPYTLKPWTVQGKLIISQATLGVSSSQKKSTLQCNVGDRSPIYLCTLLPDKYESIPLNFEFAEDDDVKFSVLGPTSIHLSGFIQGGQDYDGNEYESDSYGEDIAETESEESSDYDSESEDGFDFIDDNMLPPSPVRRSGVIIEEIVDDEKPMTANGTTKQPKKKKQTSAKTKNEKSSQQQIIVRENTGTPVLESEDEDGFPIPSSHENVLDPEKIEADVGLGLPEEGKKKKKNSTKDGGDSLKSLKRKVNAIDLDEESKSKAGSGHDSSCPTDIVAEENLKMKKKKKAEARERTAREANVNPSDAVAGSNLQKLHHDDSGRDDSEQKKNKKNKKKGKLQDGEGVASEVQNPTTTGDKKASTADKGTKDNKSKHAKMRTYANGLVIEELEMGEPDGKRASRGSKVSVRYIGKLQKTGKCFDSNIGRAPFKFRLGVGAVIKGWDVGVEGMRVGDKRRLIIPPSMGYGATGYPPTIPPNSWLVFDVELVAVL